MLVKVLDVFCIIDCNEKIGFFTIDFLKPTSKNTFFFNVKSHHLHSVFKSIVYGETIRIRRLNEKEDYHHKSLNTIEEKCINSNFNKDIVFNVIQFAISWKTRLGPNKTTSKTSCDRIA